MARTHRRRASIGLVVLALLGGSAAGLLEDSTSAAATTAGFQGARPSEPLRQPAARRARPAAPRWGPPESVAAIRESPDSATVLGRVAVRGRRVMAVWDDPLTADPRTMGLRVASRRADGTWTRPRTVARFRAQFVQSYDLVLGPRGSALVTWSFEGEVSHAMETHLRGKSWSRPRRLGGRSTNDPSGVIDGRGVMTVAWTVEPARRIAVASQRPGRGWGRVHHLRDAAEPRLATNRRGHVVVAWSTTTGVGVAVRRPGGTWGRPRVLPSLLPAPTLNSSQVAVGPDGRALVMWSRHGDDAEGHTRRHLAWARSRHDGTWTGVRYLDTRRVLVWETSVSLSMNGRGDALAVWWTHAGRSRGSSAARFRFGRGWTTARRLGTACCVDSATLTPSGTAVAVLGSGDGPGIRWAFQQAGRRWQLRTLRSVPLPISSYGSGQRVAMVYFGPTMRAGILLVAAP